MLVPGNWPDLLSFMAYLLLLFSTVGPVAILSRGKIRIELTEQAFRAIWTKRFILSKETDVELSWYSIIDYVYQEDRGLDSFKLTLTEGRQFEFYRYTYYPWNDDFEDFVKEFPEYLRVVELAGHQAIPEGKTEFESRSFRWVLVGMTILALGILINLVVNPDPATRWASLGVIFSGILFDWMKTTRRK